MANNMKWAVSVLGCLAFGLNVSAAADLSGVHTVYLMPMGHGLDQFIASRLTRMHVIQVVTDPAKADTIFTDQVGAPLEDRLKDMYPPPPDPEAVKAQAAKEQAAKEKAAEAAKNNTDANPPRNGLLSMMGDPVNKTEKAGSMGVGGRGRGTLFLVDVKSRQVLWSAFEKPKNTSPQELDHTAERVVKQLKEDLSPKTAKAN